MVGMVLHCIVCTVLDGSYCIVCIVLYFLLGVVFCPEGIVFYVFFFALYFVLYVLYCSFFCIVSCVYCMV